MIGDRGSIVGGRGRWSGSMVGSVVVGVSGWWSGVGGRSSVCYVYLHIMIMIVGGKKLVKLS